MSTSELPAARRYALAFALAALAIAVALLAFSRTLEPITGDLARLSGLSERDYGWSAPQRAFVGRQYDYTTATAPPRRHHDLLVFGDSFSEPKPDRATWVDYVAAASGLSTLVVRTPGPQPLIDYLRSPSFHDDPPRVIILETVTRNLAAAAIGGDGCPAPGATVRPVVPWRPTGATPTRATDRATRFAGLRARFTTTTFTLRQRLENWLVPPLADTARVHLTRRGLLSARASDDLLYFSRDAAAQNDRPAAGTAMVCTLRTIAAAVEARGRTRFMFVPALDKSVAYAAFEAPRRFAVPPVLAAVRAAGLASLADPSPAIVAAIAGGTRDVYLPDDTHWGYAGAAVAADVVIGALHGSEGSP